MTFEELNNLIVAVRAYEISYDFFARTVEMVITPEYGVKDEAKGKTFKLKFENCIYFGGINSHKSLIDDGMEFIVWGMLNNTSETDKLLSNMYTITGSSHMSSYSSDINPQGDYFFENVFGDVLRIIASQVTITEII